MRNWSEIKEEMKQRDLQLFSACDESTSGTASVNKYDSDFDCHSKMNYKDILEEF